jgi:membrane protein YdbS with pleckstrin-like domain
VSDLTTDAPGQEAAEQPSIADGIDHPLDPRVIPLQQAIGWIVAAVLGGGSLLVLFIVWLTSRPSWPVMLLLAAAWLLAAAGLAWLAHRWPSVEYRFTSYRLDDQGLEIRRGVYWRSVTNVPRSRVQHTDVSQGPLERGHGLGTLIVYTAGTDHARVELPGLDHATALRIREHLLPRERSDGV